MMDTTLESVTGGLLNLRRSLSLKRRQKHKRSSDAGFGVVPTPVRAHKPLRSVRSNPVHGSSTDRQVKHTMLGFIFIRVPVRITDEKGKPSGNIACMDNSSLGFIEAVLFLN